MNLQYRPLEEHLQLGLRTWRRSRLQRGIGLALLGLLALAVLFGLSESLHRSTPVAWWVLMIVGFAGWGAIVLLYLVMPWLHKPSLAQVARYVEEKNPGLEDRLVTALEFGRSELPAEFKQLLDRLVQDAAEHTRSLDLQGQLQLGFASGWRALLWVAVAVIAVSSFFFADAIKERVSHYFSELPDMIQAVKALEVSPGDTRVARGDKVEIIARSPDAGASEASLYLANGSEAWLPSQMNLTTELGKFTYEVFDVRDTVRYYVRVGAELSPIFTILAVDAPEIKNIRLTYRFADEIGLAPKTEEGSGDLYAPSGTEVDVEITASQTLSKAEFRLGAAEFHNMSRLSNTTASATLEVQKDGYYVIKITNTDGMSNSPVEYFIHVTPDELPQITISKPGRDTRPTMLEEVPLEVAVREDYGLRQLALIYSHNNQPQQRVDLLSHAQRTQEGSWPEFRAEHLLYLEELDLKPGDFLSYHFEASDGRHSVISDLYFMEVRPFEEEFYRALSQGGAGGNEAGLAISQKEILTATWKLEQNRSRISPQELESGSAALAETQEGLRESIVRMAQNTRLRESFTGEGLSDEMVPLLEQAAEAMKEAGPLLEQHQLAEALDPERRAYHLLLQVDATIRKRVLTQGSSSSSSYAQLQDREDLARLFKDELDKIQSKYETLQQSQQQQHDLQINEAAEKVRELAQRQERLVDLNRQMAREPSPPEDRRRQIEKLRREQEQINRDIQNLKQQLQQTGSRQNSGDRSLQQVLDTVQQALDDMQRASDNLRRSKPSNAAAEGQRALDELHRIEDQLERQQASSLRQNLTRLREELQNLAESQSELSDQLQQDSTGSDKERLLKAKLPEDQPLDGLLERQDDLRRRTDRAMENLRRNQTSAESNAEEQPIAQGLKRLNDELGRRNPAERMKQAGEAIQQNDLARAQGEQREAIQALRRADSGLKENLSQLAETPEEKFELALDETQQVRQKMEESLNEAQTRDQQREGQQGSPEVTQPSSSSGSEPSQEFLRPETMEWWSERLWDGARQLEQIAPFMQGDSALTDDYARLLQNYRGRLRSFRGGDPQRLQDIEQSLLDPLRRLEAELATRLAALRHQEDLLTVRDERVPPQYREMVEKYFEELSKSKK